MFTKHRVPITDLPTKFSLTKFGSDATSTFDGGGNEGTDFKVVPFNDDVMTGTEAAGARRLLLLEERKVD